jgi:glyoxylase-like metal-dependent hydrolase (beta-lactamase superfamily II)
MKVVPWGAHLAQLERFGLLFPVSCYFVREDDGLTLVDATVSGSATWILRAAREVGAPIGQAGASAAVRAGGTTSGGARGGARG